MTESQDFTYVGNVTGSQKFDREEGGPKFKIQTEGAGPDAKVTQRSIWVFQMDRDGDEHPWWGIVKEAILAAQGMGEGSTILKFSGYSTPAPKKGNYWNGTEVEPWDGETATSPAATTATAAPGGGGPRAEGTKGSIARWAVEVAVGNLEKFDNVPTEGKERAAFIVAKAVTMVKIARNVEEQI